MSLETIDKEYIGQVLLNKGFRTWFLYMFRVINGKPFIVEPIHKDMFDLFQNILDRKILRHNLNVPPRSAKCLGKGTLIRMFNGSQKPIEQIKVGELVMGDDNTPRKVLNTNTGFEEMFEITLQDGSRFICNKSHILVLRNTEYEQSEKKGHLRHYKTQKIDTISVADYLRASANYKKRHKMIKTALEYKSQDVLIEPYVLGYWLGDGHSKSARITGSFEDVTELSQYLDKINYKYKSFYFDKRGNNAVTFTIQGLKYGHLKNNLKKYDLINNKHIPECYLLNDKETRLKLFAGLIDSDGSNCKNKNNIEFSNKNETLIDNTMELGRSLGFFIKKREIYVKGVKYFKLSIIGDFEKIPCLHKRKIDKSNMKFNRMSPLLQYFTIKSLGIGQYYGFELDGNHKFVLGDFTISHNTTLCKYLIAYAYAKNPKCNFIYTSYSQSLLADIANDIIGILEHPVYKAMYPQIDFAVENNQIQPVDEFWRDYFISNDKEKKNIYSTKKIITYAGGVCWFASLGSQLTGVGCFDYNTIVHTDKGIIKIGDIVENKKEVKILSYDFTSKKRIYKPIDRYIKNEKSHFIKIILNNGETINCTPDHLFYLQNGQSIIASGLKIGDKLFSESSNPLYLTKMKIKHFCNILSSVIFIKDKANFTNRISFKNIINFTPLLSLVSKPFCYFSPNKTAFNIRNRRCRNVIIFGNFLICSFIFGYIYCLTGCEFHKFSILEKLIVSVGLSCAIFQIFKRIIGWIRIFVSDFKICRTFTNKSKQNKRMNGICFPFSIVKHKTYSFITFFYGLLFKNLVRFFAKNFPRFTDIISGKIRDVIVVDIVKCNHITPSYCVSVRDTNNLFIGKSQQLIHNCGTRGSQEFSGGIICFPYEQEILTNAGKKKIGEIVENKENVLVLSYDFDKNKAEYMPIDRYIKNSGKFNCVTVHLKNGESFKCTDNHKIYTLNRGWVEAVLLTDKDIVKTCSNSFKLFKCNIKFFTKLFTSDIPISYSLQRFVRKFYSFSSFINNLSREILETFFRLNSLNRSLSTIKTFCDFIKSSGSFCNILNVFKSKFTTRKNKGSQFNCVLHIIGFSPVFKIFQPIIRWIRVKMSNFNSFRLFANKSPKNQTMNPDSVCLIVFSKINIKIAVFFSKFKFFLLKYYLPSFNSTSRKNFTFFGNYITFIRNHIIFKFGYSFVNSVVFNNHIYDSYCVTVHKNHNLFVGKNQYILASNCDDGDKPSDIHSEIMREKTHKYFSETLLSRLNDSNAFILNVQQRLHTEDLTGFLSEVYGYKSLVKPLFDDGVLQIPSQYSEERLVEIKKDDAVFSAQYQQEPVPETGMLIHTDKFKPYDVPPQTFDLLYICCDTAFSEKKSADNSAFMLMGVKGYERYILDLYCKKVDFVNLRKDLKEFYNKALAVYGQYNNFSSIYIEAKASGISLIQQLRSEGLPVQEIYPTVHNNLLKKDEVKDKLTRFYEVQADIESGYVNIPSSAPWLKDFIKECLAFTGGKQNSKDDRIDSFLYCLKVARKNTQTDWEAFARAFS